MAKSYYDGFYRTVKNMTQVSSSPSNYIVDSVVYSSLGLVDSVMRPRYQSDTTSSKVWTKFKYDVLGRLVKTIYPDSSFDSVHFVNDSTVEYISARGNKKVNIIDFEGNLIESEVYDTTGSLVGSYTYEYGKMGRLEKTTDLEGRSREYEYDEYGQVKKLTDPDVGIVWTWYNTRGQKRLIRYNTETTYSYFKYDTDNRLTEFGTVANADTTKVDSASYPSSGTTKTSTFRYDTYTDTAAAADTAGGLGYCLGRVTEVRAFSGSDSVSVDHFYYDARGRIGLKSVRVSGFGLNKLKYEYYDNGELKKITYPNNYQAAYDLDMAGRVTQIKHTKECLYSSSLIPIVQNIQYDAWGPASRWDFENGLQSRREYDAMGRLEKSRNYTTTQNLFNRKYNYDKGFIDFEFVTDTSGDSVTDTSRIYQYDSLGRLSQAWLIDPLNVASLAICAYSYDLNGNPDSTINNLSGLPDLGYHRYDGTNCDSVVVFEDDSTWFFTKDGRGRITRKTSYPDDNPSDSTLWKTRQLFTYDHRNLITAVRDTLRYALWDTASGWSWTQHIANFYYNADGQRVKAVDTTRAWTYALRAQEWCWGYSTTTKTNYYVWSGGKVVYEKIGSSEARNHIYGLGEKLASAYHDQPSGWGGGMMMMSQPPPEDPPPPDPDPDPDPDPPDTCYTRLTYYVNDQYGSVRAGMSGSTVLTKLEYYPYGEVYSMSGGGSVYTFLGKEDPGVGMLDFGPRYYNAMLGRFLSPDPILAGASAYAYCAGNPIMLYDPSGMFQEYVRPPAHVPRGVEDEIAQEMESEMRMCEGPGSYMVVGGDEYFIGTAREYQTMQQQKRDDELGRPGSGMKSVKITGMWVWLDEKIVDNVVAFFNDPIVKGLGITINCWFRTTLEQSTTKDGAQPGTSMHEAALAFDANVPKELTAEQRDLLCDVAASNGLQWGYPDNWTSPNGSRDQTDLLNGRPPSKGYMHFQADPVKLGYGNDYRSARTNAIRQNQRFYYQHIWRAPEAPPYGGWTSLGL